MFKELIKKKKVILALCLLFLLSAGFLIFPIRNFIFQEAKSKVKQIIASFNNRLIVFGQGMNLDIGPYVFPHYPQRLKYLSSEISLDSEEILALNQELNQSLQNCDCKYVQSQCYQPQKTTCLGSEIKVLGDPCLNRKEIEGIQGEITKKTEELTFLKKVLEIEIETGLKRELETIDPERAEKLKKNLEDLLNKSSDIISLAEENRNFSTNWRPQIKKVCQSHCQTGEVFGLKGCLKAGTAEQKPIDLKFKVGVGLDDLDLGKVEIKNIGLNLPEEIQLTKPKDVSIDIPGKEILVEFKEVQVEELKKTGLLDLATPSFNLSTPQVSTPKILEMKFDFPLPKGTSSYQCSASRQTEEIEYNELNWYFRTIDWLFEKCQKMADMKDSSGGPTEKFKDCMEPEKVHLTIINECQKVKEGLAKELFPHPLSQLGFPGWYQFWKDQWNREESWENFWKEWWSGIWKSFLENEMPKILEKEINRRVAKYLIDNKQSPPDWMIKNWREEIMKNWPNHWISFLQNTWQGFWEDYWKKYWGSYLKNYMEPPEVYFGKKSEEEWSKIWDDEIWPKVWSQSWEPFAKSYWKATWENYWPDFFGKNEWHNDNNKQFYSRHFSQLKVEEPPPLVSSPNFPLPLSPSPSQFYQISPSPFQLYPQFYQIFYQIMYTPSQLCIDLFKERNEAIPFSECKESPIRVLEDKCNQLKDKTKELPEPCKILPLLTGKIELPADLKYSPQSQKCSSQVIADFPAGLGLPNIPKIHLDDIIIPDVKLPHWKLWPFLEIKLPSFIFEDLVFPEINLCDIDNCKNVFSDLKFQRPIIGGLTLDIPPLRLPPLKLPIDGIGLIDIAIPEIKLGKILLPSIPFPAPDLPLLSLMTPELDLPEISTPSPKLLFSFAGMDTNWITDFIVTLIINALGIPDFSLCIDFNLKLIPIKIIFPDYYFGWPAFPKIPQIPFCEKTNKFCKDVKIALKQITDKQKKIEDTVNKAVQGKVQAKLDQINQEIEAETSAKIEKILKQEAEAIKEKIKAAVAQSKIENGILKVPPVYHQTGDQYITIPWQEKFSTNVPQTIPINWPESLKKIALIKSLGYDLPTIPLNKLSYEKEIPIKLPGFQKRSFDLDLGSLGECFSQTASGGNPYSLFLNQIQDNIKKINNTKEGIDKSFQEINFILQF